MTYTSTLAYSKYSTSSNWFAPNMLNLEVHPIDMLSPRPHSQWACNRIWSQDEQEWWEAIYLSAGTISGTMCDRWETKGSLAKPPCDSTYGWPWSLIELLQRLLYWATDNEPFLPSWVLWEIRVLISGRIWWLDFVLSFKGSKIQVFVQLQCTEKALSPIVSRFV